MKKIIGIFLLSFFFNCSLLSYDQSYIEHVSERYLNSFGPLQEKPKQEPLQEKDVFQRLKEWFKPQRFTIEVKELTEREKRERVFKAAPITPNTSPSVINTADIDKLEVLQGNGEDQKVSLFSRIFKPYLYTKNGERGAVALVSQPEASSKTLLMRQAAIRSYYSNPVLFDRSINHLKDMADSEHYFLDFFDQEDPAHEEMYKKVYWNKWFPERANKNAVALEIGTRLGNLGTVTTINAIPISVWLYSSLLHFVLSRTVQPFFRTLDPEELAAIRTPESRQQILALIRTNPDMRPLLNLIKERDINHLIDSTQAYSYGNFSLPKAGWYGLKTTGIIASHVPEGIKRTFVGINNNIHNSVTKGLVYTAILGSAGLYGFSLYKVAMDAKFQKDVANHLQTRMIGVASYLNGIKEIYHLAQQDPALRQLPCMVPLAELVNPSGKHSEDFNTLVKLLSTHTFKGKASFFSLTGRALAAFKLMQDKKQEFADALRAIGEIETYIAVAKLMHAHDTLPNGYSFVEFIESDTPYIKMTDFWNPMIDPNKAVANSIEFSPQTMRSMILTGPNTGGKSTGLKAMMINELLAQFGGICAAKHMAMTSCSKLISYLNVTDNTMAGVSGLKAEILQAKRLIETIRSLPRNQFAFMIIDEIFTATSPDQAEKLAYDFLKQLCNYENCIFIDATHYAKLTELEKETNGTCKNYQVEVITDPNGKVLKYTYKIKEGISEIKNASQVAQEGNIFDNRF